jgi:hypothetical protein
VGFSSWDCKGCKHPALSPPATNATNQWMVECVAIMPNGALLRGAYSGYADFGGVNVWDAGLKNEQTPLVYHRACWESAGMPQEHDGKGSEWAADQGWFFDDPDHSSPPPGEPGHFVYQGD